MPTLHWIGKEKVVNHHQDVPYRVLEHQYGFDAEQGERTEPTESGNKIIHGDNLEALKSLLPGYEGKIKCIYIDPPYNTGEEGWAYNDNVNHPKIKRWLGEVVGKEGDDLSRHDKWLCMMYPRLQLLFKLLSDDGVIFISIDDYESHHLISIANEIFGIKNKIATVVWDLGTGTQAGHFVRSHEYVLVYCKNKNLVPNFKGGAGEIKHSALKKISKKNPKSDFTFPKGTRFDADSGTKLDGSWGGSEKTFLKHGEMISEDGELPDKVTLEAGWAMKSQMKEWFYGNKNETYDTKGQKLLEFYFNSSGVLTYRKEKSVINPPTVIRKLANTKSGSKELEGIIGENNFDFPKPHELIKYLIKLVTSKNDIVLDSFAGTGTTGQAVQQLNKEDGGNRNFILVEMEDYADSVTSERVKRVIKGYHFNGKVKKALKSYKINITNLKNANDLVDFYEEKRTNGEYNEVNIESDGEKINIVGVKKVSGKVNGIGGSFDFYQLGQPLFDENKLLNEDVEESRIREYVWYSETKTAFPKERAEDAHKHLLGTKDETDYYFFYEKEIITTLNHEFLATIKQKSDQYVIYADNCLLSKEFLQSRNIIFKKIPRDISRF